MKKFIIFIVFLVIIISCKDINRHYLNVTLDLSKDSSGNLYILTQNKNKLVKFDENLNLQFAKSIDKSDSEYHYISKRMFISQNDDILTHSYILNKKNKTFKGFKYAFYNKSGNKTADVFSYFYKNDDERNSVYEKNIFADKNGTVYILIEKNYTDYYIYKITGKNLIKSKEKEDIDILSDKFEIIKLNYGKSGYFTGLYIDDNGLIYTCDSSNNVCVVFQKNGELLKTFGEEGLSSDKMLSPNDIYKNGDNYCVVNLGNRCLSIYDKNFEFIKSIDPLKLGYKKKDILTGKFFDLKNKTKITLDRANDNIIIFDENDNILSQTNYINKINWLLIWAIAAASVIVIVAVVFRKKIAGFIINNFRFNIFYKITVIFLPIIVLIPIVLGIIQEKMMLEQLLDERKQRTFNIINAILNNVDVNDLLNVSGSVDYLNESYQKVYNLCDSILSDKSVEIAEKPYWIFHKILNGKFYYGINNWQGPILEPYIIPDNKTMFYDILETKKPQFGRIKDESGEWISGLAPVLGSDGSVVWVLEIYSDAARYDIIMKDHRERILKIELIVSIFVLALILFISRILTQPIKKLVSGTFQVKNGNYNYSIKISTKDEIEDLGTSFNDMTKGLAERELIKDTFGKYVSKDVAEKILKNEIKIEGESVNTTVLFQDIRGFTTLSESMSPEKLVAFLNRFFNSMSPIIINNGGIIDKYIGDAIMAHFGTIKKYGDDEYRAVKAAIEISSALSSVNQNQIKLGEAPVDIGIGIHTGNVIAGNIGSKERMEYSVIGDTVNTASRLEGITKLFGSKVIISETTYEKVKDKIQYIRTLGAVVLKGKTKPIKIYEALDADESAVKEKKIEFSKYYNEALRLYHQKEFENSLKYFNKTIELNKYDKAAIYYTKIISELIKSPPPSDWIPCIIMSSK